MSTLNRPPLAAFPGGFADTDAYPVIPQDGLLAWYEFDDGSGSTLTDKSVEGNDGTISGSAVWSSEGLIFDGSDDRVVTSVSDTAEFTRMILFQVGASPASGQILLSNLKTALGVTTGSAILTNATDDLRLSSARDTSAIVNTTVADKAVAGQWRIATATRWGSGAAARQQMLVSGRYYAESSMVSGVGLSADPLAIGDSFVTGAFKFKGVMAMMVLYDRRITPDEESAIRLYMASIAADRGFSVTDS